MERALKPILSSIGLDFQARSYAMGGYDVGQSIPGMPGASTIVGQPHPTGSSLLPCRVEES